ncbi:hypothetical protein DL96DRAFT_1607721 [Flagelloscypha sp. PMI_526]|nr:hypothetical protein DL96DRAFT_1607721 [Flagelloscypha sp. PMI_526]
MGCTTAGLLYSPIVILYFLPARWKFVEVYKELVRPKGRHIVIVWIIFFVLGFPCAAIAGALCSLKWEGVNAAVNTLSYCFGMSMFGLTMLLGYLFFNSC